jgi:hypothetical protein
MSDGVSIRQNSPDPPTTHPFLITRLDSTRYYGVVLTFSEQINNDDESLTESLSYSSSSSSSSTAINYYYYEMLYLRGLTYLVLTTYIRYKLSSTCYKKKGKRKKKEENLIQDIRMVTIRIYNRGGRNAFR